MKEGVTLKGVTNRGTNLRVSASWADAFDHLVLFQDAATTTSMFNARLEDMSVNGESDAFVTRLIWARAWNEHCGLKNVIVKDFMKDGLELSNYYGGAATSELNQVEFFVSSSATDANQAGIRLVDPGFTVAWHQFLASHVVFAGNITNGKTSLISITADGRTRVINKGGLHAEKALAAVVLTVA